MERDRVSMKPPALLLKSVAAVWAAVAAYLYFWASEHHLRITADALNNVNWNFQKLQFFSLFQANGINPYQGMGDAWSPSAPWLRLPEVILWLLGNFRTAVPAEDVIYMGMFGFALYTLGRAIAPTDSTRIIALMSFAISLLLFPPITFAFFPSLALFAVVPYTSFAAAITIVLLALWIRIDTESWRHRLSVVAILVAVTLYGVAAEPLWIAALPLFATPFFVVMTFLPLSKQALLRRAVTGFAVLAFFYLTGTVDYVLSVLAYTSRTYFPSEVTSARDTNVAYFARDPQSFRLFLAMVAGIILALFHSATRVRAMAVASLITVICAGLYDLAWLFYPGDWGFPLPTYAAVLTTPIFALVALFGAQVPFIWIAGLVRFSDLPNRFSGLSQRYSDIATRYRFAASPWLFIPLILSIAALTAWRVLPNDRLPHYAILRQSPPAGSIGDYLKTETAILPGSRFRGSVALRHDFGNDLQLDMMKEWDDARVPNSPAIDLWTKDIPTYDEYSATVSPLAYYLMSRLASDAPYQFRNAMPYPGTSDLNLKMLQAVGTRFFLTKQRVESPQAQLRRQFKSRTGEDAFVYEFADPNRDGFSPTQVRVERIAEKYLALLASDDFQFRRDVVLTEPIDGTLVKAKESQLYFTSAGPRVVASSPGKSLLVLPIQYSRCLAFRAPTNARLVRANLIQAAVLFEGRIDVTFEFLTGPFVNPRCRKTDLREAKELQVKPDGRVPPPPPEIYRPFIGKPILPFLKAHLALLLQ